MAMLFRNTRLEITKLTTARGSAAVFLVGLMVILAVSIGAPLLSGMQGRDDSYTEALAVGGFPLAIFGPILGALLVTPGWHYRDNATYFVLAPSRAAHLLAQMLAGVLVAVALSSGALAAGFATSTALVITGAGEMPDFSRSAGVVLGLGVTSTLAGVALAALFLSLPLTLVFILLQTLVLDPALSFGPAWGQFFQASALASALIGEASLAAGLVSGIIWIVVPAGLGLLRQQRYDLH